MGEARQQGWTRWATAGLVLCFVALRLLPIRSGGSFIDEYLHVFSGAQWLAGEGFPHFYRGEGPYLRGAPMSLWVGVVMWLSAGAATSMRLAPLAIGLLCLWLFRRLCGQLLDGRPARGAALSLFVVAPLIVFDHVYVRFYVVYEAALLGMLSLAIDARRALLDGSPGPAIARALGVAVVAGALLTTSHDAGAAMPALGGALCLASIWLFDVDAAPARPGLARLRRWQRALLLLALAALAFPVLDLGAKIDFLLHGELRFTSATDRKYVDLLVERGLVTLALLVGAGTGLWVEGGRYRLPALTALSLLSLHLVSSPDLQIRRGLMYLLPVLYLCAAIAVDRLARRSPAGAWALAAAMLGNLALCYPAGFFGAPSIPSEISYIEYAPAYAEVRRRCGGHTLVDASPSPHIGLAHGVRPDAVVFRRDGSRQDRTIERGPRGRLRTVFGHLPVVTAPAQLPDDGRPVCLLVRSPSAARILSRGLRHELTRQPHHGFAGIDLYRLAPAYLRGRRTF